jgi:hypothetical protein
MVDDISPLKELEKSGHISNYKHLAPTELKHSLYRTDVKYELLS